MYNLIQNRAPNYVEITPEVITSFRGWMRAFGSDVAWNDELVTHGLIEADTSTGSHRWGAFENVPRNFKRRGMFNYAAHWLSVTYATTGTGENPEDISPTARLNVAAKSVGDESITYRVGAIQETEEDWLSLSDYGVQFLRLRRSAGLGAMAL